MRTNKTMSVYSKVMEEIKGRAHVIRLIHAKEHTSYFYLTDIEFCSLQLRKILEILLFALLVANKKEYDRLGHDISKEWKVDKKLKEIKSINPQFFPVGIEISEAGISSEKGIYKVKLKRDTNNLFNIKEFNKAYKFTSKHLHIQNPFSPEYKPTDIEIFYKELMNYLNKLMNLLKQHRVTLCNGECILCDLNSKKNGKEGIEVSYLKVRK